MRSPRRFGAALGAVGLLSLAACLGSEPGSPDPSDPLAPSLSVPTGDQGGDAFSFLPPLNEHPVLNGTFNPDLSPAVSVCRIDGFGCAPGDPLVYFPAGSVQVGPEKYFVDWDTDGDGTGTIDPDEYYMLQVLVGGTVMGSINLDPNPAHTYGPLPTPPAFYGFRIGDTIPVRFWLSTQVGCEVDGIVVLECITNAVIDENGGELTLEEEGERLSLFVPQDALPGDDHEPVLVTLERVDPDELFLAEGVQCIPSFDAPQFGPCFRITTVPELESPLDEPALVSICVNPATFPVNVPLSQQDQLQIIRYATDGSNVIQGLSNVAGSCPVPFGGLLPVPESGPFRFAARGVNALARLFTPEPVLAHGSILLGGLSSSFSRYRFALPGQMQVVGGDSTFIQSGGSADVEVIVRVADARMLPVEGAHVHFGTSDGSLDVPETDSDLAGFARVTWTVDTSTPGQKLLTISALGLLAGPVPDHSAGHLFVEESVVATAFVVGPPAAIAADPTEPISGGTAGGPAGELTIVVTDASGRPVSGAPVTWTGDGSVSGGDLTGDDGSATGAWTLSTVAGTNTMTASVGGVTASFEAVAAPGAAANLVVGGDNQTGPAGQPLAQPLSARVLDQYGNPRAGDAVTWSVTSGGGTITGQAVTNASGIATATWTLGSQTATQQAGVNAGGLAYAFGATVTCRAGYGTATVDGAFAPGEWACAQMLAFQTKFWGGRAPGEVYWMNDGSELYLAVRMRRPALWDWPRDRNFDSFFWDFLRSHREGDWDDERAPWRKTTVRFDFDNDGDNAAEANDDVIGYDLRPEGFFDGYLTSRCLSNRQANCATPDMVRNGQARARIDGAWTVYELSHPLDSGDPKDFDLQPGDAVGFFLTLFNGHGPFADTQIPGFRRYQRITVVGP